MVKITLSVTKLHGDKEIIREITFDAHNMAIEDWFQKGSTIVEPNACKIFANGECYRANISRGDLEAILSENGIRIIKTKKQ